MVNIITFRIGKTDQSSEQIEGEDVFLIAIDSISARDKGIKNHKSSEALTNCQRLKIAVVKTTSDEKFSMFNIKPLHSRILGIVFQYVLTLLTETH